MVRLAARLVLRRLPRMQTCRLHRHSRALQGRRPHCLLVKVRVVLHRPALLVPRSKAQQPRRSKARVQPRQQREEMRTRTLKLQRIKVQAQQTLPLPQHLPRCLRVPRVPRLRVLHHLVDHSSVLARVGHNTM